jgi:acetyl esterase/lipase
MTAARRQLSLTYISVGGLDLFLEENLIYADRLSRAGVPVELLC